MGSDVKRLVLVMCAVFGEFSEDDAVTIFGEKARSLLLDAARAGLLTRKGSRYVCAEDAIESVLGIKKIADTLESVRSELARMRADIDEIKREVLPFLPEVTSSIREEELIDAIVSIVRDLKLAYWSEIRDALSSTGYEVSQDRLYRALRAARERGLIYEVAPRLFSVSPDVSTDMIAEKYRSLSLGRSPSPITGSPLYVVRFTKSGDIIVMPNRRVILIERKRGKHSEI